MAHRARKRTNLHLAAIGLALAFALVAGCDPILEQVEYVKAAEPRMRLEPSSARMRVNETIVIKRTLIPDTEEPCYWYSDSSANDYTLNYLYNECRMRGLVVGRATITAIAAISGATATCEVEVLP